MKPVVIPQENLSDMVFLMHLNVSMRFRVRIQIMLIVQIFGFFLFRNIASVKEKGLKILVAIFNRDLASSQSVFIEEINTSAKKKRK